MAGDLLRRRRGWCAAIAAAVVALGCTHDFDDLLVGSSGAGAGVDASSTTGPGAGGKPGASSASSGGSKAEGGTGGRDPGSGGSVSSASSGGSGPGSVSYSASVADCVDINAPNPDTCAVEAGAGQMFVDTMYNTGNGQPRHLFIRFDLDGMVAGKTVTSAALSLTISVNGSDNSGEVWEVTGFDRPALFATVPTNVGGGPAAAAQGPVINGQEVVFQLPTTLIVADAPVYLGLRPLSDDAPFYWNNLGTSPPQLRIEYQ